MDNRIKSGCDELVGIENLDVVMAGLDPAIHAISQMCRARLPTANAASLTASESVGCG